MLRCAITEDLQPGENADDMRVRVLAAAGRWAFEGVEFAQLRAKKMDAGAVLEMASAMLRIFAEHGGRTKLLVNGRADIAAASGADGVHLTSRRGELTPSQVRRAFAAGRDAPPTVSVSCHMVEEVARAADAGADLILFGPVFEKVATGEVVVQGAGLAMLKAACVAAGGVPLLALGGVNAENTTACLQAGAAGIAGIRRFGQ